MTNSQGRQSSRLDEIVEEFSGLEPRERLELLLEFSEGLAPLPPKYEAERDAGQHRVHECQTPVFLWVDLNQGHVQISAYVAPEAPTVKGFVSILADALSGSKPTEVLAIEPNLVHRLGLIDALGMMRARGLQAILYHIRRQVAAALEKQHLAAS